MKVTGITGKSDTSQVSTATHLPQNLNEEKNLSRKFSLNAFFATVFFLALLSGFGVALAQAQSEKILYLFSGAAGGNPYTGVVMDASGNLYGTTPLGGAHGAGTVFELTNSSGSYTAKVLYNFNAIPYLDGTFPSNLIMDASGDLYGTNGGGTGSASICPYGCGIVFELVNSSGGYTENVLYNFTGLEADGSNPSGVIMDASGNLYGTTYSGGTDGEGAVFELVNSSGSYAEKLLYSFTGVGSEGTSPQPSNLILDASGNLYGVTTIGGTGTANICGGNGCGTVFELVNSSGSYTEKVLYNFTGVGGDGGNPFAGVIRDGSGNLYGITEYGGTYGYGTVFELVNSSGSYAEKVLYSFSGAGVAGDGANPYGGLTMDASGNLYGTTYSGGTDNDGTVFELVNSSGSYTEKVLYNFTDSGGDGATPSGSLVMDASGNLYGTTYSGATYNSNLSMCEGNGCGTVFELVNIPTLSAPAFTSPNATTFSESMVDSFTVTTSGLPAPSLTESGAMPSGVTFTDNGNGTGTLAGTPVSGTAGTYPITFEASNSAGSSTQSFTLTVNSGGSSGGSGTCSCTRTGDYVNPAPAVDPSFTVVNNSTLTSPNNKYTATFTWYDQPPVQNVTVTVTLNSTGATVFNGQNLPYSTNFGFSPDDDRFVLNNTDTVSSENYVYVYDLTSTSKNPIVTTALATSEARLQFSPSGRYFLYTALVNPSVATLQIYRVQGVTSQDLVYSTQFAFEALATSQQDQYGGVNWGFGPGSPETSFVYAYATGQSSFQWTLVNLASGRTVQNASLTNIADYWQFNPCGNVVALVSQTSPTQVEVDLYNASTGEHLPGSGGNIPSLVITLESTSSGEEIIYSGQTSLLSASICGQANTSAGSNTGVAPMDSGTSTSPVQLTFSNVTQLGQTTATITSTPPSPPTATDFQLGNPAVYYDLSTTAVFSGTVTICINYGGITFINPSQIQLFHYTNGAWVNITTSVNSTTQTVCGSTTSFSPFALFEPSSPLPQTVLASVGTPQQSTINGVLATALQATVTDTNGNLIPGIPVIFAAPLGGPTGIFTGIGAFATVTTGSNGVATAPGFTADGFAGNYTITASVNGVSNPAAFSLTNTPGAPAISWIPASPITYGTALSSSQLDATASVPGTFTYTPALGIVLSAGTQGLSAAFSPSDNVDYNPATATASIVVQPAALTVSANGASRPYGTTNPLFTAAFSGFVNGDSTASLSGTLSCSSPATQASPVGTYAINCSGVSSSNYSISFVAGTLTVTAVPLTIMANNQSRQYGAPNPIFSVSYSGFVNGDSGTVLSGTLDCTTTANAASPVGIYPITCSGLTDNNYTIDFVPGSLTVTQAAATITANNQAKTLDSPNPTLTWTASGFVNGDTVSVLTAQPSCTTTATTSSPVGTYPITCSGAAALDYYFDYVSGTLTVVCHYVSISLSPSTVVLGGTTTVQAGLRSCAATTQIIVEEFTVSGPLNPETCAQDEQVIFKTPPFPIVPKTDQNLSFPFVVPKLSCSGTFTIKATTLVGGKAVDSSIAALVVQ